MIPVPWLHRYPAIRSFPNWYIEKMRVLLGISGGIAAYKSPEIIRLFQKQGDEVRVVVTPSALEFVTETVLRTLCHGHVMSRVFQTTDGGIDHIEYADWADVMVVAPATAQTLYRLASGSADEPLSLNFLATTAPRVIFPAMNVNMWQSAATRRNVATLRNDGFAVVDPDSGDLACGWTGPGRLPDPAEIVRHVSQMMLSGPLSGRHVVITAGPTREHIDPVRYISNPSTGKMGYALAEAAAAAGATVSLVSGPVSLPDPGNVNVTRVTNAKQMHDTVQAIFDGNKVDVFIAAAAVADYTPAETSNTKLKKDIPLESIALSRTDDILAMIGQQYPDTFLVGFAAETDNVIDHAVSKLEKKRLNLIVANQVGGEHGGFADDRNQVTILDSAGNRRDIPLISKIDVARDVIRTVADQLSPQRLEAVATD